MGETDTSCGAGPDRPSGMSSIPVVRMVIRNWSALWITMKTQVRTGTPRLRRPPSMEWGIS